MMMPVGKGKVTPRQAAIIVDRYLRDNNNLQTLSVFRSESSSLVPKSQLLAVPENLLTLENILNEYIIMKEERLMVVRERERLEREKSRFYQSLEDMRQKIEACKAGSSLTPHPSMIPSSVASRSMIPSSVASRSMIPSSVVSGSMIPSPVAIRPMNQPLVASSSLVHSSVASPTVVHPSIASPYVIQPNHPCSSSTGGYMHQSAAVVVPVSMPLSNGISQQNLSSPAVIRSKRYGSSLALEGVPAAKRTRQNHCPLPAGNNMEGTHKETSINGLFANEAETACVPRVGATPNHHSANKSLPQDQLAGNLDNYHSAINSLSQDELDEELNKYLFNEAS